MGGAPCFSIGFSTSTGASEPEIAAWHANQKVAEEQDAYLRRIAREEDG
jgi:hypothetical protein